MTGTVRLTVEQHALLDRIQRFSFDTGPTAFPFALRLARDNGWSLGFAVRAITEYRRFAFLAIAAGHPVTPSDHVDQVWHLHLLYTESYWVRFCQDTLRASLHHHPTQGGEREREKFITWYANTLDSYRRFFLDEPPADLWPPGAVRFGQADRFQWVNRARYWLVRKPFTKGGQ